MRIYRMIMGLLMVSLLMTSWSLAGVSDSDRIHKFEEASGSLADRLDAAGSLETYESLKVEVFRLRDEYVKDKELIDFNLAGTFENRLRVLTAKLNQARERINQEEERKATRAELVTTRETLVAANRNNDLLVGENANLKAQNETLVAEIAVINARIAELAEEKANLEKEIATLELAVKTGQETTANLQNTIQALKSAAGKNQETINQLKSSIQNRDDLILTLMESLNRDFEKAPLPAEARESQALKIDSDRFQEAMLTTIKMNTDFLDSTTLEAADLQTLRQEQRKFAERWATLKPAIAKLYAEDQAKLQALREVDSRIVSWQGKIDQTVWKRLHQVLIGQNFPVSPFSTATELHDHLIQYIDGQINSPAKDKYTAFREVWEKQVKQNWLPVLPANDRPTEAQLAGIENRLAQWADETSFTFTVILWAVGIIGAFVLVGALVVLLNRKGGRRR